MASFGIRQPGVRLLVIAGILLAVASGASLLVGVSDFISAGGRERWHILLVSRLPRTLAAILTGSGLAIAGLVMQTIARNRFVEPMTAGTGQSAALGILLVTMIAPGIGILGKSLVASCFAFAGSLIFMAFARRLPPEQPFLVPLFGIIYGGVIGALGTAIAWQADLLQFLDIWMNGEFSGVMRGRYELLWLTAGCVALAWWVADRLTIMSLGRDMAVGLGLNYAAMLQVGLVIVSLIAALTVTTVGALPFVGLVVPALVARRLGDDVRAGIPATALAGAGLVLLSDTLGRIIRFPYEIPAGTILGIVGAIAFLFIIFGRARHA